MSIHWATLVSVLLALLVYGWASSFAPSIFKPA
jgi:hypothetical protein